MQCRYTVVFEPLLQGGYGASVRAIPEIATFGATLEEVRGMAKDALPCFLESALRAGEPIPRDLAPVMTERLAVSI